MSNQQMRDTLRAVDHDGRWSALMAQQLDLDVVALADAGLVRIEHRDDEATIAHLTMAGAAELAR